MGEVRNEDIPRLFITIHPSFAETSFRKLQGRNLNKGVYLTAK